MIIHAPSPHSRALPLSISSMGSFVLSPLVAILLLIAPAFAAPSAFTTSAPTVQAAVDDSDFDAGPSIRVTIKIPKPLRVAKSTLIISRKRNSQSLPSFSFFLSKKRSSFTFFDQSLEQGAYTYRSRLRVGKQVSRWSARITTVVEEIDGGEDGTPTPSPTSGPSPTPTPPTQPDIPEAFSECANSAEQLEALAAVNAYRLENDRAPLQAHPYLYYAALAHSVFMAGAQDMTHAGFQQEIIDYDLPGNSFGQNIANYFSSPTAVIQAWISSESHRANILGPNYSFMGIACVRDGAGIPWWTQVFSG